MLTLPNIITLSRLIMVPAVVWCIIDGRHLAAFWLFVLAGIGDGVDGFLARQFNLATELGAYLDPIADKALLVSIYVALAIQAEIPIWLTIMVVSRDILIVGAVMLSGLVGKPVAMRPLVVSKANTASQILLAAIALGDLAFGTGLSDLRFVMVVVVASLTGASALAYLVDWVRHMARA